MTRARAAALVSLSVAAAVCIYVLVLYPWLVARGQPIRASEIELAAAKAAAGTVAILAWSWSRRRKRAGRPIPRRLERVGVVLGWLEVFARARLQRALSL